MYREKEYFEYFEKEIKKYSLVEKHPLLCEEVSSICKVIKEKIKQINDSNFFEVHPEILGLDARLQVIFSLLPKKEDALTYDLSDEEIIDLSKNDYKCFIKELSGFKLTEETPNSLYFMVV